MSIKVVICVTAITLLGCGEKSGGDSRLQSVGSDNKTESNTEKTTEKSANIDIPVSAAEFTKSTLSAKSCQGKNPKQCFTQIPKANLPFEFAWNIRAPASDTAQDYEFYPGTRYWVGAGSVADLAKSKTKAKRGYFVWVNRCATCGAQGAESETNTWNGFTRTSDKMTHGFVFSTMNKANTCTKMQIHSAMGATLEFLTQNLQTAGLKLLLTGVPFANIPALASKSEKDGANTKYIFEDTCLVHKTPFGSAIDELVFDFEPHHYQKGQSSLTYLEDLVRLAKRYDKKTVFWSNAVDGGMTPLNGILQEEAPKIVALFDRLTIQYEPDQVRKRGDCKGSKAGEAVCTLNRQLNFWGILKSNANHGKFFVMVPMNRMELAEDDKTTPAKLLPGGVRVTNYISEKAVLSEFKSIRNFLVKGGYGGITFWRNSDFTTGFRDGNSAAVRRLDCLINDVCE